MRSFSMYGFMYLLTALSETRSTFFLRASVSANCNSINSKTPIGLVIETRRSTSLVSVSSPLAALPKRDARSTPYFFKIGTVISLIVSILLIVFYPIQINNTTITINLELILLGKFKCGENFFKIVLVHICRTKVVYLIFVINFVGGDFYHA